ncbi:AAEL004029-PA, partial [Aedes aegypti]
TNDVRKQIDISNAVAAVTPQTTGTTYFHRDPASSNGDKLVIYLKTFPSQIRKSLYASGRVSIWRFNWAMNASGNTASTVKMLLDSASAGILSEPFLYWRTRSYLDSFNAHRAILGDLDSMDMVLKNVRLMASV